MIVLVGFMGAGKTTVGSLVADRLGLPFVDTDRSVEAVARAAVAEIFAREGEARFRALEKDAVEAALQGLEAVVALGGGAVTDPTVAAALEWHTVVHLDVSYPEAMRRIGHDPGRPMLAVSDPRALFEERHSTYQRIADRVVRTDGRSVAEVADEVVRVLGVQSAPRQTGAVRIALGARSYDVHVGADAIAALPDLVPEIAGRNAFVVTHPGLVDQSKVLVDVLSDTGARVSVMTVPEGEASKSLGAAERLLEQLAEQGATRADVVIAFGGGVIGDLAGFVASIYHRGMPFLQVPTSLLAQVDAATGGKTAVNLATGKNLAGTIHQPLAVLCDVSLLRTLPEEELRAGLAEVVKHGLIADPGLLDVVVDRAGALFDRDQGALSTVVRRSVAIKAAIVSRDERESGLREALNYGHTFGHGIEHVTGMRHGEAISVGMMAAARAASARGMLNEADVTAHRDPLLAVGLPVAAMFDVDAVVAAMERDKKNRARSPEAFPLVLLRAIGRAEPGIAASVHDVTDALRKVRK